MQLSDFNYDVPEHLIARYPLADRVASRLLHVKRETGDLQHAQFKGLIDLLYPGDLLVLNNSKVIPARLFATKETGARVEILIERILSDGTVLALMRANRSPKPSTKLFLQPDITVDVIGRRESFYILRFLTDEPLLTILERIGEMPLPPYLNRSAKTEDTIRYQTVYADPPGSVAAPTAGLHFDQQLLQALTARGVSQVFVTCHVGAGTFQPIKTHDIRDHTMHAEYIEVDPSVCEAVRETKSKGGRVIAVGTTSMRCLESAASTGKLMPYKGETRIFIYPGFRFHVVDGLITNFHLPRSSLILLVAAFAGYDLTMHAYQTAIAHAYRFYSFGDAMLITDQ